MINRSVVNRRWLVTCSAVSGLVICVLLAFQPLEVGSQNPPAPASGLSALMVGPSDMPCEVVLFSHEILVDGSSPSLHQAWYGMPGGTMSNAHSSIRIVLLSTQSHDQAVKSAELALMGVSTPPKEVSGQGPFASLGDRAWYGTNAYGRSEATGGRLLFVRGTVKVDIYMSHKEGLDERLLFKLAARVSSRIDAALAGKPESAPILPLAADQELRLDLEGAWKMRNLGKRLWGNEAVTIAIYDADGIPRAIPAKRLGPNEYVVPLRHIGAVLGPRARLEVKNGKTSVRLGNKDLVFEKGSRDVTANQHAARLDRAVESGEGEILVPLTSLVRHVLGRRISWEQRGDVSIARIQ